MITSKMLTTEQKTKLLNLAVIIYMLTKRNTNGNNLINADYTHVEALHSFIKTITQTNSITGEIYEGIA